MAIFKKAAGKLPRASDADAVTRLQVLSQPPTPPPVQNFAAPPPTAVIEPSTASIGAAVKMNPRQRKPKVWYDPTPEKEARQANKRLLPPPNPPPSVQHFQQHHHQTKDFPVYDSRSFLPPISIETTGLAPYLEMLPQLSPLQCPPRNIRPAPYIVGEEKFHMRFSDPLGKLGYNGYSERVAAPKVSQQSHPEARQEIEHAPSEQLLREEEAAQTLAWMLGARSH
ncbi:hypothetical protein Micbo1qcDRAFT_156968 [Microdochium bolleyi]|uniref:Uncharacterized protein n=1 Tax=Microdochium bolleyi TaxID=196109 RepID=A0A136JDA3_9PEZI|nr:hypothetical protein Micbo1qcDRAFT_156968 [Microdochium bolleyi]